MGRWGAEDNKDNVTKFTVFFWEASLTQITYSLGAFHKIIRAFKPRLPCTLYYIFFGFKITEDLYEIVDLFTDFLVSFLANITFLDQLLLST